MIDAVLITGGLAGPLIGVLGPAIGRSLRRLECARVRDQLVDAARCGELDVTDWRVFSLIDWFDQVATTGRPGTPGRHAPGRTDPAGSLAASLATTLIPLGPGGRCLVEETWPEPGPGSTGPDLRAAAIAYRRRQQARLRLPGPRLPGPRLPGPRSPRIGSPRTGLPRPRLLDLRDPPAAEAGAASDEVVLPSLIEEIFAVAVGRR